MKSRSDSFESNFKFKTDSIFEQVESDEFQIRMSFFIMSSDHNRLSVYSPESQRAMIYSLWNSKQSATSIHEHLLRTVGPANAMSLRSVQRWCKEFRDGRKNLDREPGQGRKPNWTTVSLPSRIQEVLDEDCRITVRELELRLQTPQTTIFNVMKSEMGLVKLSARWVPRLLTDELKQRRMETCQRNIQLVQDSGGADEFLSHLVTSDETWICHFEPETKQQSMVWAPKGSNPPVKAMASAWKKKVMMTAFFDQKGVVTLDFLEGNATINSNRYCESLRAQTESGLSKQAKGTVFDGNLIAA